MREYNIHVNNDISLSDDKDVVSSESEAMDQMYIIKFIVTGAFYPNYFKTVPADPDYVVRTLNGKNPKTTVVVKTQEFYF